MSQGLNLFILNIEVLAGAGDAAEDKCPQGGSSESQSASLRRGASF